MELAGTDIVDTFAEAFPMSAARVIVTAATQEWARIAGQVATGYATSVIACDCEAGIERDLLPTETPDGRPGVSLLFFAFNREALQKALVKRVGQCVLTCPTSACYDGLPIGAPNTDPAKRLRIGGVLRYFGDSFQSSKKIGSRRFWRIPTLDGEFLCEDTFGTTKGVGGGNFFLLGSDESITLAAAARSVAAMRTIPNIILPFPGGVVRSGSKVGSKYPKLVASTNERFCPTLRGLVDSVLPPSVNVGYEIVIDGIEADDVAEAMRVGIETACGAEIIQISAGNYGGKLGPIHLHLHELLRPAK